MGILDKNKLGGVGRHVQTIRAYVMEEGHHHTIRVNSTLRSVHARPKVGCYVRD
jgi:hypothetical protein